MASLTFQYLSLPSSFPIQTIRRTPSSSAFPLVSKSSQSQFYGLSLSFSSSFPVPSSTSLKTSISAKVNKGEVPPPFSLKDQDGKNVSLSKFKGKPVVVYFYPADETPGCTKQACAFRDSYEKFKKAGAQVVGISGDDPSSHKIMYIEFFSTIISHIRSMEGAKKLAINTWHLQRNIDFLLPC